MGRVFLSDPQFPGGMECPNRAYFPRLPFLISSGVLTYRMIKEIRAKEQSQSQRIVDNN